MAAFDGRFWPIKRQIGRKLAQWRAHYSSLTLKNRTKFGGQYMEMLDLLLG